MNAHVLFNFPKNEKQLSSLHNFYQPTIYYIILKIFPSGVAIHIDHMIFEKRECCFIYSYLTLSCASEQKPFPFPPKAL